ncbi:Helicase-like transcription factor [Nymphaea thermarum]|nr:Helicase-like transcription factor [Nymphaea thermarum]
MAEERNSLPPPPMPLGNDSLGTVAVLPTATDIQSAVASTGSDISSMNPRGGETNHSPKKQENPASVLRQWAQELSDKVADDAKLLFLVYYGTNRTKDPFELAKYDVVLTTYSIVSMEVPKQPLFDEDDVDQNAQEKYGLSSDFSGDKKRKKIEDKNKKMKKSKKHPDGSLAGQEISPLARVRWFRVVLDEAQTIKNYRTQVARACCGLRAKRRWCLSGTPIQNAIDDLYSYFRFLRYDPYSAYNSFCTAIKYPISRNSSNGYKKLQAVLGTMLLRRTKGSFIDGQPIINLPPKSICLKKVEFSLEERIFYSNLEAESRLEFKPYCEQLECYICIALSFGVVAFYYLPP